jgi:hypothetical protein
MSTKANANQVAALLGVPVENVKRLYGLNAAELRACAAKAGGGKYRGKTADEWNTAAEHAEAQAMKPPAISGNLVDVLR